MKESLIIMEEGIGQFPIPDKEKPDTSQLEELLEWAKKRIPYYEPLPGYDVRTPYGTIRAGLIHTFGAGRSEKPQKLFCYLGIPDGASAENKVPGVLLIHGGGGQAFSAWTEEWMKRGYAAVQLDCYGNMPLENGRYCVTGPKPGMEREYRATPTGIVNQGFDLAHPRDRLTDQGIFHVAAANILAGNLLRAQDCVDEEKIGITGISWGGFSACIIISYDQRFAFAAPVYGTACLDEGQSYFHEWLKDPDCAALWEVKGRLRRFNSPILWVNDSQDHAFPPDCSTGSFLRCRKGIMCLKYDLPHYHKFDIEEVYVFADHVVRGGRPLPVFAELADRAKGREYTLKVSLAGDGTAHAELYYLREPVTYHLVNGRTEMAQAYEHLTLGTAENGLVYVRVPEEAAAYFIEIWQDGLMTSTPLVEFYRADR